LKTRTLIEFFDCKIESHYNLAFGMTFGSAQKASAGKRLRY